MTDDFKKWLCEKAELYQSNISFTIYDFDAYNIFEILIKAMWAINREYINTLTLGIDKIIVQGMTHKPKSVKDKDFIFEDYNNSEQEALEKALEYICDKE